VSGAHGPPRDRTGPGPLSVRQQLDAAGAEGLLAGRDPGPEAPVAEQALAGLLAAARGPASPHELADEAAYVAMFVMATKSQPRGVPGAGRPGSRRTPRRLVRLALAAAAAVVAVGCTAYAGVLPPRIQEMVHVTFGAPAPHLGSSLPPGTPSPSAHRPPSAQPSVEPPATRPGKASGRQVTPPGQAKRHQATPPGQAKRHKGNPAGQTDGRDGTPPGHVSTHEATPPSQVQG
jgi:hypothetical protein